MTSARHKENSFMSNVQKPMSKNAPVFECISLVIRHFVLGKCMQELNERIGDILKSKWTFALSNHPQVLKLCLGDSLYNQFPSHPLKNNTE